MPDSPSALTVYIDSSLYPGNMAKVKQTLYLSVRVANSNFSQHDNIVNCEWSGWSNWHSCTKTCGSGTHQRERSIDVVVANGGTNCTGNVAEGGVCNPDAGSDNIL